MIGYLKRILTSARKPPKTRASVVGSGPRCCYISDLEVRQRALRTIPDGRVIDAPADVGCRAKAEWEVHGRDAGRLLDISFTCSAHLGPLLWDGPEQFIVWRVTDVDPAFERLGDQAAVSLDPSDEPEPEPRGLVPSFPGPAEQST